MIGNLISDSVVSIICTICTNHPEILDCGKYHRLYTTFARNELKCGSPYLTEKEKPCTIGNLHNLFVMKELFMHNRCAKGWALGV